MQPMQPMQIQSMQMAVGSTPMQQAPPPMGQPMAQKNDPSQLKGKYVHLRPPEEQTTRANYSRAKAPKLPGMSMIAEVL